MPTIPISRRFRWSPLLVFTVALLAAPRLAAGQLSGTAPQASSCQTRGVGAPGVPCNRRVPVSTKEKFDCQLEDCFVSGLEGIRLKPPMYYKPLETMKGQWRLYLCHRELRATDSVGLCDPVQVLETYREDALAAYYKGRDGTGFPKELRGQLDFTKVSPPCSLLVWAKPDSMYPFASSVRFVVSATGSTEQETHRCLTGSPNPR